MCNERQLDAFKPLEIIKCKNKMIKKSFKSVRTVHKLLLFFFVVWIVSWIQGYVSAQLVSCFRNFLTKLHVVKITDLWSAPYTSLSTPVSSSSSFYKRILVTFCRRYCWYCYHSPHFPNSFYHHRQRCVLADFSFRVAFYIAIS